MRRTPIDRDRSEVGASVPEYALIIGFFVVALFGIVQLLQNVTEDEFDSEAAELNDTPTESNGGGSSTSTSLAVPGIAPPVCVADKCTFSVENWPTGQNYHWQVLVNGNATREKKDENKAQVYNHPDSKTGYTMYLVNGKKSTPGGDQDSIVMTCTGTKAQTVCHA